MKKLLLLCILLLLPVSVWSATWSGNTCTCADTSRTEVASCVTGAQSKSGDVIINIPEGSSATWTTPISVALANNGKLTINGSGTLGTILNNTGRLFSATVNGSGQFFELNNIKSVSSGAAADVTVINITGTRESREKFRIHHCYFSDANGRVLIVTNPTNASNTGTGLYGLYDYNTDVATKNQVIMVQGTASESQRAQCFAGVLGTGTSNAVYIENNTSTYPSKPSNGILAFVESEWGARVVIRYNNVKERGINTHGYEDLAGTRGQVFAEIYNNTFACEQLSCTHGWTTIRGGAVYLYNNTVTELNSNTTWASGNLRGINLHYYGLCRNVCGNSADGSGECLSYPCTDQPGFYGTTAKPMYIWGNTLPSGFYNIYNVPCNDGADCDTTPSAPSPATCSGGTDRQTCFIRDGRDFYTDFTHTGTIPNYTYLTTPAQRDGAFVAPDSTVYTTWPYPNPIAWTNAIDSFTTISGGSIEAFKETGKSYVGLSFKTRASANYSLTGIKIKSYITATAPTGPITAYIYSDSSGSPGTLPGALLATSTNTIEISTLAKTPGDYEGMVFTFPATTLVKDTRYHVVLQKVGYNASYYGSILWGASSGEHITYSADGSAFSVTQDNGQAALITYGNDVVTPTTIPTTTSPTTAPTTSAPAIIETKEIITGVGGIVVPVTGVTPSTLVAQPVAGDYVLSDLWWQGNPSPFMADTEYTAVVTIIPSTGRTLTGVGADDFFTCSAAKVGGVVYVQGKIAVTFPKTEVIDVPTITSENITGITKPVKYAIPDTAAADDETGSQFTTGTVTWTPDDATFLPETVYTAHVTVTEAGDNDMSGVRKDHFKVADAVATNDAVAAAQSAVVVSAEFPPTAPVVSTPAAAVNTLTTTGRAVQSPLYVSGTDVLPAIFQVKVDGAANWTDHADITPASSGDDKYLNFSLSGYVGAHTFIFRACDDAGGTQCSTETTTFTSNRCQCEGVTTN